MIFADRNPGSSRRTAARCAAVLLALVLLTLFVFAAPVAGDANGDGTLNSADAVYLLRCIMLPGQYETASGFVSDVNSDGEVNSADAVYLLRHILLPENYPLPGTGAEEEETKEIAAAVEKALSGLGETGSVPLVFGFPEQFTEEALGEALLDYIGLDPARFSLSSADGTFEAMAEWYGDSGEYRFTADYPFTVTGAAGGSYSSVQPIPLEITKDTKGALKAVLQGFLGENAFWSGKLSEEGYIEMECSSFPTADELVAAAFRTLSTDGKKEYEWVNINVEQNEYYDDLREAFEEAEIGDTVSEYLDYLVYSMYNEDKYNATPEVEVVITKTAPSSSEEKLDLFEKLRRGEDVDVLIIGDSIAAGVTASWNNRMRMDYLVRYGSCLRITNVAVGGTSSYTGYVNTNLLAGKDSFDLAVICYGANDSVVNFGRNYESIVRTVMKKYPGCEIIPILQSYLGADPGAYGDYKLPVIREIADRYGLTSADTVKAFADSGYDYYTLAPDGCHPGYLGMLYYAKTLEAIIDEKVASGAEHETYTAEPVYPEVSVFENFTAYPASAFARVDEVSYEAALDIPAGILGIEMEIQPGTNEVTVTVAGEKAAYLSIGTGTDIRNGQILAEDFPGTDGEKTVRVTFSSKSVADQFGALVISFASAEGESEEAKAESEYLSSVIAKAPGVEVICGFLDRFTEENAGGQILSAIGLDPEKYHLTFGWDFSETVHQAGAGEYQIGTDGKRPVTISGPAGGKAEGEILLYFRFNPDSDIKNELKKAFGPDSVWSGKMSDDGYMELEVSEFPTADEFGEYIIRSFDLSKVGYLTVRISVSEDDFFRDFRTAFEEAEIGDEVEEYVEFTLSATYGGYVTIHYTPAVEVVLTKDDSTLISDYIDKEDLSYRFGSFAYPTGLSKYTEKPYDLVTDADLYVSPDGDDSADGSFAHPLATFDGARLKVRELKARKNGPVTVAFMAGVYPTTGIVFEEEDSGSAGAEVTYCAYGDGEVLIDCGVGFGKDSFEPLTDAEKALFRPENADKIVKVDLNKLGIDSRSLNSTNLLYGDRQQQISARYPNISPNGFDRLIRGQAYGGKENNLILSDALAERFAGYHTLAGARISGYMLYDWLSNDFGVFTLDEETNSLYIDYYDEFRQPYFYIYGVSEELDTEGEYYLDGASGMLYLYAPDCEDYHLAINNGAIRSVTGSLTSRRVAGQFYTDAQYHINHLRLVGLDFGYCTAEHIVLYGDDITVERCNIYCGDLTGIWLNGYRNTVRDCELYCLGGGGIYLFGGDRATLTKSESIADNNYVHDFSRVHKTHYQGIKGVGCGITISHNEICFSPISAIDYCGNYIIMEYNYIHDVVQQTSDGGAFYDGRDWTHLGNEIRYNVICNVGNETFGPQAIYNDDNVAGVSIKNNFLYNIAGNGISNINRESTYTDNVLIGCDMTLLNDQHKYIGTYDNWLDNHRPYDGQMWQFLNAVPYRSAEWAANFPRFAAIHTDVLNGDPDDPDLIYNPSYNVIDGNMVFNAAISINTPVYQFSRVGTNTEYYLDENPCFTDPSVGDYTVNVDGYPVIPFDQIGRY